MQHKQLKKKFRLRQRLGSGAQGDVFLGKDPTYQAQCACKFEENTAAVKTLEAERDLYLALTKGRGGSKTKDREHAKGIPRMLDFYIEENYKVITLECLGPSIKSFFVNEKRFSWNTTLQIAVQLIDRLEFIHGCGILHNDIKPANMAIGRHSKSRVIFIMDFGLASKYCDADTGLHIPYKDKITTIQGNLPYMSINTNACIQPSRRDDLEAVGYVLAHFHAGNVTFHLFLYLYLYLSHSYHYALSFLNSLFLHSATVVYLYRIRFVSYSLLYSLNFHYVLSVMIMFFLKNNIILTQFLPFSPTLHSFL